MKPEVLKLFAKLMEKGYITREQEPTYYEFYALITWEIMH